MAHVLVVGGSFAEAAEVEADERFSAELERRLSRPDRPVEVWNMGVGDYGTAQEYLLMRRYLDAVHPDVVVLEMFPLNDIVNVRDFAGENESQADYLLPYFVLDASGGLVRADRHPLRSFLRRHSRLFADVEFAWWSFADERLRRSGVSREADIRRRHRAAGELPVLEYRYLWDDTVIDGEERAVGKAPSIWVLLAADERALAAVVRTGGWTPCRGRPGDRAWSDDRADVLGALHLWAWKVVPARPSVQEEVVE